MRYGYENIKNIKCGKVSLTEKNKTVNSIYLDITDKFENIANFTFTTNEAEQLANELLQAVFDATEVKENTQDNYQKMWKYISTRILDGEPDDSEFYRCCDRLKFNRFECNNGDLHLTSNAINTNVLNNVIQSIFDITKDYDTGGHPVMKIIIHDNPHGKEHHHEFNGHQEVIIL